MNYFLLPWSYFLFSCFIYCTRFFLFSCFIYCTRRISPYLYFHVSYIVQEEYLLLIQEEDLLLPQEEHLLLPQEEDLLPQEDLLLQQEEDFLLPQEEDLLLPQEDDLCSIWIIYDLCQHFRSIFLRFFCFLFWPRGSIGLQWIANMRYLKYFFGHIFSFFSIWPNMFYLGLSMPNYAPPML